MSTQDVADVCHVVAIAHLNCVGLDPSPARCGPKSCQMWAKSCPMRTQVSAEVGLPMWTQVVADADPRSGRCRPKLWAMFAMSWPMRI